MRVVVVALTLVALSASSALAQAPGMSPITDRPEPQPETYRGWIGATSGLSLGLFVAGAMAEGDGGRDTEASDKLFGLGIGGFLASGPIIHAARGNWKSAGASLALRFLVPGLTAGIAMSVHSCDRDADPFCELDAVGPGWLIGAVAVSIVDTAWLAVKERPPEQPRVVPFASASRAGGIAGVAGSF
jgi:hypothetical protein